MADWRLRTGVLLGLAGAVAFVALGGLPAPSATRPALPAHGPLLSECDGALSELVIQYVPGGDPIVAVAYRDLLRQLPEDVTVHVACPDQAAFDDLCARVGPVPCRLHPVVTGHAMTCWARDRWLAFAPLRKAPALLLAPCEEAGEAAWPARHGDKRVAFDLAAALRGRVAAASSALAFDAGDFVADAETVFVTPRVAERNVGRSVSSEAELREALTDLLKKRVVLLPEAPPHHAGMFLMLAGSRTALVGDPSLARALPRSAMKALIDRPDLSPATQRLFDAVAATCAAHGYRVVRIPTVPDEDGRTYLTYVNALLDSRGERRAVYMPVYHGAEALNDAAEAVWKELGYEVRRVDCTAVYPHSGSLHCLVNILRRS